MPTKDAINFSNEKDDKFIIDINCNNNELKSLLDNSNLVLKNEEFDYIGCVGIFVTIIILIMLCLGIMYINYVFGWIPFSVILIIEIIGLIIGFIILLMLPYF